MKALSATWGADSELDSGLSDIWILKSEQKRELWRIAAISPFTSTATSVCRAQKETSLRQHNRFFFFPMWNQKSATHRDFSSYWNNRPQASTSTCVTNDEAVSLMLLLLYLERVRRIKVQLIWEICHSSFIGHCCLRNGWSFGQLKEPESARNIADVTCKKIKSWLSCMKWSWMKTIFINVSVAFWYLLLLWAHCCRSQRGSLKQGAECWNLCCGPMKSDPAKTESRPFPRLQQARKQRG